MNDKMFRGTGVALVTPFKKDKSIDFDALERLVNHVIENGVNYLVALGTTAETPTLSNEEKIDILKFIVKINNNRLPLVCGVGGNNTQEVLDNLKKYPLEHVDAILSVSPYYNKPTQAGIIAHFKEISKHSPVPIILYNVPGRTGSNMLAATTLTLANECKNIIAIKEACGNMAQSMELAQILPEDFTILSGDDDLAIAQIAIGFDGVISVAANCFTKDFSTMISESLKHNFVEAKKLHYKLLNGISLLFTEGNPPGVKAVLNKMHICENEFRLPVVPISNDTSNKIDLFLKTL